MLQSISRKQLFRNTPLADHIIADIQKSYASDFDKESKSDALMLRKWYDHLSPFHPAINMPDANGVMAYTTGSKAAYLSGLPQSMYRLLTSLGIEEVCLLDDLNFSFHAFPFASFNNRNILKQQLGSLKQVYAITMDCAKLLELLPLFLYANKFDKPVLHLITSKGEIPLCMDLCDDGNWHLRFYQKDASVIKQNIEQAGMVLGDAAICSKYSIYHLK